MKKIFLFGLIIRIILLVTIIISYTMAVKAQSVAVNTTGTPADASAMLDIASTSKGFLAPRMTTAQRTGIISPANGLLVFDTDTKSYWYFSISWKEINNASGGGSFSLPYAGSGSIADKIFSIANADSSNGATAIYGKSGNSGIGLIPGINMGVWGDNSRGIGILGTSVNGVGAYGLSFQNHGVSGYSTNSAFAGVYGSHANNGAGIMGEMSNSGMAVYGKSTGTNGKAGMFEATNSSFADSVLVVKNAGFGLTGLFTNTNSTNGNAVVSAVSNAIGDGYYAEMNNTTNTPNAAFRGINNSLGGYGLYAESGLGMSARLFNSGVTNNSFTLDAKTNGTGAVGNFTIANADNNNNILQGSSTGIGGGLNLSLTNTGATGIGINLSHSGTGNGLVVAAKKGKAGVFSNTDATNSLTVLDVSNIGTNNTARFVTNNSANSSAAVTVNTNGTGRGLQSTISNNANNAAAVYGSSSGAKGIEGIAQENGVIGQSTTLTAGIGVLGQSALNDNLGIGVKGVSYAASTGVGAITGINNNGGNGVYGSADGANAAGVYGESTTGSGVSGFSQSGHGIYGVSYTGDAIYGYTYNGGNGVFGFANGANAVGVGGLANPSSGTKGAGISGSNSGAGNGVDGHAGTNGYGVYGESVFQGVVGVYGESSTGNGVKGVNNSSNNASVLGVNSSGNGVAGTSNGTGHGVFGTAGTTGAGVYGRSNPINSTGRAALFEVQSSQNTYDAVVVNNAGLAGTLNLKSSNSNNGVTMVRLTKSGTGDYMVLENGNGDNLIRFGTNGVGFFNGGTLNSGADMAEAFDVEGNRNEYEPGDVLIISTNKDRTVVKSDMAYSTLVAGVYATKPGVLMTEEKIDTDLSDKVPMGVVGVIPTKVCLEGGEIKRGDLLVTSSINGVAMKADIEKVKPGQVIGKALENYSGNGIGKIKVLVNVK